MRDAAERVWAGTGRIVEVADDLPGALDLAETMVGPGDGVVVAGSLLTVGAARDRYLPVAAADEAFGPEDALVRPPDEDREPLRHGDGLDDLETLDHLDEVALDALIAEHGWPGGDDPATGDRSNGP
jgi:hypothetical protein